MQTATTPDVQTAPPPQAPQDKPANGAGSPEHLAALPTDLLHQNEEITRKLASIETLGRQVIAKGAEVSKQETKCAEIKANLDNERESLHKLERERDELQDELTLLATGRASERLPFKEPAEKAAKTEVPASADAWKSVTLEVLGIKSKRVLKALHDHKTPIVTHGDLAEHQNRHGDFWAKEIKGLGAAGREEIENAQAAYWQAHPQPKAEASPDRITGAIEAVDFDDATISEGSVSTVVDNANTAFALFIQVGRRRNGQWSAKYNCLIAGKKNQPVINTNNEFAGNYRNRAEAIVWATDEIDTFTKTVLNAKPSAKVRDAAKEVRRILDRIDKQLAAEGPESAKTVAEGLPSPEAQGAHDAAVTEKDQTAKRARKGKA